MLSQEDIVILLETYKEGNSSYKKLAKQYNIGATTVRRLIHKNGISSNQKFNCEAKYRKYTLNEKYFDIIGDRQSYWLGWLLTDGYHDEGASEFSLELQESDRDILDKFNNDLCSNRPLFFIEEESKHPTWQNGLRLSVCSSYMSKRLSDIGFRQNKSMTLTLKILDDYPEINLKEFLRGFWDGNGGFYIKESGYLFSTLTSTINCCNKIKDILSSLGIDCYTENINDNEITSHVVVPKTINCFRLMSYLYEDAKIYLDRKYQKFIQFKESLTEKGII